MGWHYKGLGLLKAIPGECEKGMKVVDLQVDKDHSQENEESCPDQSDSESNLEESAPIADDNDRTNDESRGAKHTQQPSHYSLRAQVNPQRDCWHQLWTSLTGTEVM